MRTSNSMDLPDHVQNPAHGDDSKGVEQSGDRNYWRKYRKESTKKALITQNWGEWVDLNSKGAIKLQGLAMRQHLFIWDLSSWLEHKVLSVE